MDFQKSFQAFNLLFAMQFMVLTLAVDLHNTSIEDYVNYINPPAVHKYQHENGDTILCVKYEDQISLKKDSRKSWMDGNLSSSLSKGCPEGTVHVREIKHEHVKRAGSVARFLSEFDDSYEKQVAMASLIFGEGVIQGATGVLNVWNSFLSAKDLRTRGLIRIGVEVAENPVQIIEAGFQVYPHIYGDPEPRFFVAWTADGFDRTGCVDLHCSGFVMAENAPLYAGQQLTEVSVAGDESKQVELNITIQYEDRDPASWVVYANSKEVGHLPANLVPDILPKINTVKWGGEIVAAKNNLPSRTDMGSGRYPESAYPKAAYVRNMDEFRAGGKKFYGGSIKYLQDSQYCYRVRSEGGLSTWGDYIFYGGPGKDDPQCT